MKSIKADEIIIIDVRKGHKAKEFFGLLKNWEKSAQEIKDEARRGWK